MSQLLCLSLDLPARITEPDVAEFEMVFSELLDSAAVSHQRNGAGKWVIEALFHDQPDLLACLLYTSPSPRDLSTSRMPSSA